MRLALAATLLLSLAGSVAAQEQMEFTERHHEMMQLAVVSNGYTCPVARDLEMNRLTGRGPVIRVRCGPEDGGIYGDFGFDVTIHENGSYSVEEIECGQSFIRPMACED